MYFQDRYRSICSAIKCPLEITADDYFVSSNSAVYDAIQAAYIVLRIMGCQRVSCLQSTIILPASVWLPNCMFVPVSVYARVQLEMHRSENDYDHRCTDTYMYYISFYI